MSQPTFVIFYVNSPQASVQFYEQILGFKPLQESPTFAMFKLNNGLMLGLWSKHTMQPAATVAAGASELAFVKESVRVVDETYKNWNTAQIHGLHMLSAPNQMEFGYNFVAQDLDGHRIRVFHPSQD